jgi:hypothetical protein
LSQIGSPCSVSAPCSGFWIQRVGTMSRDSGELCPETRHSRGTTKRPLRPRREALVGSREQGNQSFGRPVPPKGLGWVLTERRAIWPTFLAGRLGRPHLPRRDPSRTRRHAAAEPRRDSVGGVPHL